MPHVPKKIPFPKHVDYLCYTPDEYERIKDESVIIMDALGDSVEFVTRGEGRQGDLASLRNDLELSTIGAGQECPAYQVVR